MNCNFLVALCNAWRCWRWTVRVIMWLSMFAGALFGSQTYLHAQEALPSFALHSNLPLTDDTFAVEAADFNGDGALDLAVGNRGQNVIYLMDRVGNVMQTRYFGADEETVDLAVGDLNNDGLLDIVAHNLNRPSQLLLNDGNGNFASTQSLAAATAPTDQVVLGDLDGDGDYDLLSVRAAQSTQLYTNDGRGQLTESAQLPAGLAPVLVDDDDDGDLDLFLLQLRDSQPDTSDLYRYRNQGGTFAVGERLNLPGGKSLQQQVAIADFNQDGKLEFIISSVTPGCTGRNCENLRLLVDRGDLLGFGSIQLDDAAATTLQLVDLDNDGDQDLVASGLAADSQQPNDQQSRVYINNGIDLLLQRADFVPINVGAPQLHARALAVADLNGNGLLDLILGTKAANRLYSQHAGHFFATCATSLLLQEPRLVADFNGDGHQDLILQNGTLLFNDGTGNFQTSTSLPLLLEPNSTLATADFNADGRLDLVAIHRRQPAQIFLQNAQARFAATFTLDDHSHPATSVATGDIDSDGHLDLVIGRGSGADSSAREPGQNLIYLNDGTGNFHTRQPLSFIVDDTQEVAVGDLDADGDLDVAVANAIAAQGEQQGQQNYLYFNDGAGSFGEPVALGPGTDQTHAIAIGDLNGDGQLDLVLGNRDQLNVVHFNDGSGRFAQAHAIGQLPDATAQLLLADLDNDRDLDLIAANTKQADALYLNDGGQLLAASPFAEPNVNARAFAIAAADLDHDGDMDLVADLQELSLVPNLTDCVLPGQRTEPKAATNRLPQLQLAQPKLTVVAPAYATAKLFAQGEIAFDFSLFDPEGKPVDIQAFYSLSGGGQWFPALPTAGVATSQLATLDGEHAARHRFVWDVYGSNFLGHSDHVLLRLEARPSHRPTANDQPGPFARPYVAAASAPLRVRGTQVRVIDEAGQPVLGALLYKLSAGTSGRADTFPLRGGLPVRTNPLGFIESRGQLNPGDQLVALQPIRTTHAFTLYHTSAAPTLTGLDAFVVQAAGIQTLTVSAANPLALFNLRFALEWDARNDGTFLTDLENAIINASEVLYDVTDGQVALGDIQLYQAKENWSNADVAIYASNSIHPKATMGGVVLTPTAEIGINGLIPNAYWPGQINMGPVWDPYGQSSAELRQDWWLALAHELAHYLFFLPDNYLGIENGVLRKTDCQGSFMTSTYEESYREFLTRDRWDAQEECWRKSIAAHTTGRTDWETLEHFLPWLQVPTTVAEINPGPFRLPLRVTHVHVNAPQRPGALAVLPARNVDLRDAAGGEVTRLRNVEAYLFKTRNTPQLEDDQVIALGSTGAGNDRIKVRGAEPNDRLCLFQSNSAEPRVGCATISEYSTSIQIQTVPGWQPEIVVTPVNSTTLSIEVTQAVDPGVELRVQVLPAYGNAALATLPVAPWTVLQPSGSGEPHHYQQTITLEQPIFEGFVRVWIADRQPVHEAISHFFLSVGWGPNMRLTSRANAVWGPNMRLTSRANTRAWGANSRAMHAPVASGDGKVTIFNVDDVLGDVGASALQALATLPDVPLWITPIGKGYRFIGTKAFTGTIAFYYLEGDVPRGYEQTLNIYYLTDRDAADGAPRWRRLATDLDTDENLAAAQMPTNSHLGKGIYALMATVEMPPLHPTWNLFSYPIPGERRVATALASLGDAYTSVYHQSDYHQQAAGDPVWYLYDATVVAEHPDFADLVNDLEVLRFGHSYWLYATESITPYLAIANIDDAVGAAAVDDVGLPPVTFYGPVAADERVALAAGMDVTAMVGDARCGRGTLVELNENLVYKVQVMAATHNNGCGSPGALVTFAVDGGIATEQPAWDDSRAHYQPLFFSASTTQPPADPVGPSDPGLSDDPTEPDGSGREHPGGPDAEMVHRIFLPVLQR